MKPARLYYARSIHGDMSLTWRERLAGSWRFLAGMLAIAMVLLLCAAVPGVFQ